MRAFNCRGVVPFSVAVIAAFSGLASSALAVPYQWTGAAGNGNWNDPNNWLNLNTGTVNGFPTINDTAAFDIDGAVFGGAAGGMEIAQDAEVTFGAPGSASTTIQGTITNQGVATFVADSSNNLGGVIDTRWFVLNNTSAILAGDGTLVLNGSETGLEGQGPLSSLTNSAGHSITGAGSFGNLSLANQGTIAPTGLMTFFNSTTDNSTGLIDIGDAGTLRLAVGAIISGGSVNGVAGARIDGDSNGTLSNLTLTGTLTLGSGGTSSNNISGIITNNSTATFNADVSNNLGGIVDTRWFVPSGGSATLSGNGSLVLNGSETGLEGQGVLSVLANDDEHTISGDGTISNLTLNNTGTVNAIGVISLFGVSANNAGGLFRVQQNGTLAVNGGSTIDGGAINGVNGGRISGDSNGTLDGVRLTGSLTLGSGGTSSNTISGTITNNSTATFNADLSNNLGGIIDTRWFVPSGGSATLSGDGSLVLNGSETGLEGQGVLSVLANDDEHTISGDGTISSLTLNNTGTIAPTGVISMFGVVTNNSGGLFSIESTGTLAVNGGSSIDGGTMHGVTGSRVSGDSNGTLANLTLTGSLTLGSGGVSSNYISGTITNNSTATFNADDSNNLGSIVDTRWFIPASNSATLTGSGQLVLNGTETGLEGQGVLSELSNAGSHTIAGFGIMSNFSLTNTGLIVPTARIDMNSVPTNNIGGEILLATGGTLSVNTGSSINGGTISGTGGALDGEGGGALSDVTLTGSLTLGSGGTSSNNISGIITNNSTATFNADDSNNLGGIIDTRWFIPASNSATLTGSGQLVLNGTDTGLEGQGVLSELSNAGSHTIAGFGIMSNFSLTNTGLIVPTARIDMNSVPTNNIGGEILLATGGTLSVNTGSSINGGTISGTSGALDGEGGGALSDVTLTGTFTLGSGGTSSHSISGIITNNSTATFNADDSNNLGGIVDTRWFVPSDGSAVLSGNGSLVLNGSETGLEGAGATSALTNGPTHTIRGKGGMFGLDITNQGVIRAEGGTLSINQSQLFDNTGGTLWAASGGTIALSGSSFTNPPIGTLRGTGTVSVTGVTGQTLVNNGLLAPGSGSPSGTGTLSITGAFTMGASSLFTAELGGATVGSYDRVASSGAMALGGFAFVSLVDGFVPQWNQSFTIATSSGMSGSFASLALPSLTNADWVWWNEIVGNTFQIGVRHIADLNHNGLVGFDDLNFVIANWATSNTAGDVNNSGFVDFADLNVVINFFGLTAPVAVPAPGVAALAFAGVLAVRRRRAA